MEKNAVVIYLLNSILDRSEVKSSLLAEGFQNLADQVRIPVTPYQQPRKVYWIHILIHNAVEYLSRVQCRLCGLLENIVGRQC